jgi:2-polyprenyl-3-methyl-5-hydroxy-6-metoxy-1,4-benzoquinol methylase
VNDSAAGTTTDGYNERLFACRGLRSLYHHSRFNWAAERAKRLGSELRLIELGCFDGRLFGMLRHSLEEYVGLDANWEGGLDLARAQWKGEAKARWIQSSDPADLKQFADGHFDLAAALETLEHVPPDLMPRYVEELARVTRGHILVTVPNELGPVFLAKYVAKLALYGGEQPYRMGEVVAATLRRSDRVERDDHKGFDYRHVIAELRRWFDLLEVAGLPRTGLPPALSPTVGIFAKRKAPAA